MSIDLSALEGVLVRAGVAADLSSAIELLTCPLHNRPAERVATFRGWQTAFAPIEATVEARPELVGWLEWLRNTGMLQRVSRGDPRQGHVLACATQRLLHQLPAQGVPVSVLASSVGLDGHALDTGRPLSVLVLAAAARLGGVPDGHGAEWRRTVWTSVGVLSGELTNPVLTLNLQGDSRTPTGRTLQSCAAVGQPVYLTTRQLLQDAPRLLPSGGLV